MFAFVIIAVSRVIMMFIVFKDSIVLTRLRQFIELYLDKDMSCNIYVIK